MFTQKYPNNIRSVDGTVTVYEDDVTLNCDTSTGAVTVNLMTITANYWSTQYKLYIDDGANNAATNNITIVAPAGFYINGASSITINTNGGSALVRVTNNTNYIATLSSSGSAAALLYFVSRKLMTNGATTYITQDGLGVNSVLSGQAQASFNSSAATLSGMNVTTGIWTVPSTGIYSVAARMVTRLLSGDVNSTADGGGLGWMTSGVGYMAIAVVKNAGGGTPAEVICSEKQAIVVDAVSDINIECTGDTVSLTAGQTLQVYVLNKTNHNVEGMAATPTAYIEFAVTKIV